jgi:hypothetical protein
MERERASRVAVLRWLQNLDRRVLYAVFFLFVVAAHFVQVRWPSAPATHTRSLYNKLNDVAPDKVVILDSDWFAGIRAESEGQMRAILAHIMRRHLKFLLLSWANNPDGQKFGYDIVSDVAKTHGYRYGQDWVALGAIVRSSGAELASLAKDIRSFVKTDIYGTSLYDTQKLPMMQKVRDIYDVGLVVLFSYGCDGTPWIGFVQGVYGTPLGVAISAISSSTAYSFVESGQICGMLAGAPGAAEYEQLLNLPDSERFARKPVNVLSMSIAYILFAMLLGNIAYFTSRGKTE